SGRGRANLNNGGHPKPMRTNARSLYVLANAALLVGGLIGGAPGAAAAGEVEVHRQHWTFGGLFGHFDRAQLQRGYQVYSAVCAAGQGMKRVAFRNLGEKGGPEFPVDKVKGLAASFKVEDGPGDDGKMFERPGKVSDRLPSPYKNEQEARAAQNGALPVDLS